MKYYEYTELEDIKEQQGAEKLVWIIGTIQNEIAKTEQKYQKTLSELQDKLSRRNIQIKELKKKLEEARKKQYNNANIGY